MCYNVNVDYTQNTWVVVHVHCATHTFISIPMSLIKLILTANSTHPTAIHVMI
jgi:hypothetical protein